MCTIKEQGEYSRSEKFNHGWRIRKKEEVRGNVQSYPQCTGMDHHERVSRKNVGINGTV